MTSRKPHATTNLSDVKEDQTDAFLIDDIKKLEAVSDMTLSPKKTIFSSGKILFVVFVILLLLTGISWVDGLIRSLFSEYQILGWFALCVAIIGVIAFISVIISEIRAVMRLRSVDQIRRDAAYAVEHDDMNLARHAVEELLHYTKNTSYTAHGRRFMQQHKQDIIDGKELIHLAEHEILKPIDIEARKIVLNAAKRVSVITAVSPRAIIDLGYVLYESVRLIRNLATIYGARPGRFGLFSLLRRVFAHLAVTGTMAVGDGLVEQIIGQGLATRLSARFGEGVVNGLMTTRIGIATMDALRPFPFDGEKRPGLSDFTSDLMAFKTSKTEENYKKTTFSQE